MTAAPPIARRRIKIADPHGLHLRPAARFVQAANRFAAEVRVRCDETEANGKSVLGLVLLAAGGGAALDVEARGHDAEEAVTALADLIAGPSPEVGERRSA